ELIKAHRERFGREPSALERTTLAQQATLATRAAKSHTGETLGQRLDRWEQRTRTTLAGGLAQVSRDVLALAQETQPAATWSPRDVVLRALAAVEDKQQTCTRSDLMRHISDALPGHLSLAPEQARGLLEALTDHAEALAQPIRRKESVAGLPADLILADGRSAFSRPGGATFATSGQIAAERELRQAAVRRSAVAFTADEADAAIRRFAEAGCELGSDQAAALRGVMTSGSHVETLSAAAGTGKSFVVGALNHAWRTAQRRVYGLATSEVATQVLAEEGLDARNVTRWLNTQQQLDHATGVTPDDPWRLQPGDLVVVDEAGMTDTASLVEIHRRCDAAGAKLLLVGDPRQLAAVGAGGSLADVSHHGIRYELAEVRRFSTEWERSASLRLRDGDVSVLDEYVKHGRIVDAGTAEQAEAAAARAWLADTVAGRDTVALVSTNEAAARMSAALRAELVRLGQVSEQGVPLAREGTVAGVGDLVQARRNGWELIGYEGNPAAPINRRCYRVRQIRPDGGLVVVDPDRDQVLTLPAAYVAAHLTLGYASTVHAAQGRTVDTAHTVITTATDAASAYVGLTRGRDRNTAYCITVAVPGDSAPGEAAVVEERTGRAVLADVIARDEHDHTAADSSALAQAALAEEAARSMQVSLDRLAEDMATVTAARTSAILDQLAARGVLSPVYRTELAADPALGSVQQLLRTAELAGYDITAVLTAALEHRPLDGSHSPAQVLHRRISRDLDNQLTPQVTSYTDLVPADVPTERRPWLQVLAHAADQRRWELGTRVAQERPQWALETLGPVPTDVVGREEWESRAGWAAAYRELTGHADAADAIGAAPPAGLAEKHASWFAAREALALAEPGAAENAMSEGRLRVRVWAYEREQAWAPRWIGDDLAATHTAADRARTEAHLARARAEVTTDQTERRQLLAAAEESAIQAGHLTERITELDTIDHARGTWYAATAATREAADRAKAELARRAIAFDDPAEQVTAQEWLAAHQAEQATVDVDRTIRDEAELHDPARDADQTALDHTAQDEHLLDPAVPDIRETSVRDTTEDSDAIYPHRIPSADETAAAVARAQDALAEIEARRQWDEARAAEDAARAEQLNQWATDDHAADDRAAEAEPVRQ
ncbi:MAG: ATP-dependent DNA helicase, partial [Pseudonocardiaceae bacterium]